MPSTGDRTLVLVAALAAIGLAAIVAALVIKQGGGRRENNCPPLLNGVLPPWRVTRRPTDLMIIGFEKVTREPSKKEDQT